MTRFRLLALTALLISIQLIASACHGGMFASEQYIVYANEKDKSQLLWLPAAQRSWRSWWHDLPVEPRLDGQYIRGDEKQKIAGPYSLEGDSYLLKNPDGVNETRFSIQSDLMLKDDKGTLWRRTNRFSVERKLVSVVR